MVGTVEAYVPPSVVLYSTVVPDGVVLETEQVNAFPSYVLLFLGADTVIVPAFTVSEYDLVQPL